MSSFVESGLDPLRLLWAAYVVVGSVLLLVWGARVVRRLADRHAEDDKRAGAKAMVGIVLAVAFAVVGVAATLAFERSAADGIHDNFVEGQSGLMVSIGEGDYQGALTIIPKKQDAIATQRANLERANQTLASDPSTRADRDARWLALNTTHKELRDAQVLVKVLEPNHRIWLKVQPMLADGREAEARQVLERALDPATVTQELPIEVACKRNTAGDCQQPLTPAPLAHSYKDSHQVDIPLDEGVPLAYETKEHALEQMGDQLRFFVYPGLTGLALAPLVFAGGSILRAAFVPSDTVGFKPYPAKAAGWFLLLGAFGVFAIPFGAWTLRDLRERSREGQIAL